MGCSDMKMQTYLANLVLSQLNGGKAMNIPENININEILDIAVRNQMEYLIFGALVRTDNVPDNLKELLRSRLRFCVMKTLAQVTELKDLIDGLEKAGIKNQPLKGACLRLLYPSPEMREMSDIDILIADEQMDAAGKVLVELGYTLEQSVKHHDIYSKKPFLIVEVHRAMYDKTVDGNQYEYFKSFERAVLTVGKKYTYEFKKEDFYVYMIAHENKHYNGCGTGLRSLLDTYIYLRHYDKKLDFVYIDAELEKLGLIDFEQQNRDLAFNLFDGKRLTDDNRKMFAYMVESGVYGTVDNQVAHRMQKLTGNGAVTALKKIKFYLLRTFPDSETLLPYYPPAKYKVLLPFVWLYRLVKALTIKRKAVLKEVSIIESLKRL